MVSLLNKNNGESESAWHRYIQRTHKLYRVQRRIGEHTGAHGMLDQCAEVSRLYNCSTHMQHYQLAANKHVGFKAVVWTMSINCWESRWSQHAESSAWYTNHASAFGSIVVERNKNVNNKRRLIPGRLRVELVNKEGRGVQRCSKPR